MKKWWLNRSGATIIEFAVIAPIFFLLLFAIIEFGLIAYSQVVIESGVAAVAREASLGKTGTFPNRIDYIQAHLRKKLAGLINSDEIIISANTIVSGGVTTTPDICMTNPPTSNRANCDPPLTFEEINGFDGYQGAAGMNMGDAGELIEVRVYYPWRVQFPLMKQFFGENGVMMITANAIVKNEPF